MKITLQFNIDNNSDSYWEDVEKLSQIINIHDYTNLIYDMNEYLLRMKKDHNDSILDTVFEEWVDLLNQRSIKL